MPEEWLIPYTVPAIPLSQGSVGSVITGLACHDYPYDVRLAGRAIDIKRIESLASVEERAVP
jgi:hypothetical protein